MKYHLASPQSSAKQRLNLVLVRLALLALCLSPLTSWANPSPPLRPVSQPQLTQAWETLGWDDQLWGPAGDKRSLLAAIDGSLRYLQTPAAAQAYRSYPVSGITRDRVRRSLLRFRTLVETSRTPAELQAAVKREFNWYKATGKDGEGTVSFTGYFEPTYAASRTPTEEYRYPLYRLPSGFANWRRPHPTRLELEGENGRGTSQLRGLEVVWLRDRLEAFLVHVQGSARLQLTDGGTLTVGFAGKTDRPYSSIGRELINDGKVREEDLSLPVLKAYFRDNPNELDRYLSRNQSFVFFRETYGSPATGSLGVPVTAERSIATDKSLMPPGALAWIQTQLPHVDERGELEPRPASRYVLDQDTGGAIKGAGRVDIFMGTGTAAGDRAGLINHPGELYYLLLK